MVPLVSVSVIPLVLQHHCSSKTAEKLAKSYVSKALTSAATPPSSLGVGLRSNWPSHISLSSRKAAELHLFSIYISMLREACARDVFTNPALISDRVVFLGEVGDPRNRPILLFPQPLWWYSTSSCTDAPVEIRGMPIPATDAEWRAALDIVAGVSAHGEEARRAAHEWWIEFVAVHQLHLEDEHVAPMAKGKEPVEKSGRPQPLKDGKRRQRCKAKRPGHRGGKNRGAKRRHSEPDADARVDSRRSSCTTSWAGPMTPVSSPNVELVGIPEVSASLSDGGEEETRYVPRDSAARAVCDECMLGIAQASDARSPPSDEACHVVYVADKKAARITIAQVLERGEGLGIWRTGRCLPALG